MFTSRAGELDDLALVPQGAGQLAVFSDTSGLWVRELTSGGKPRSTEQRLGERCDGGLDAAPGPDATYIACLRTTRQDPAPGPAVSMYTLRRGAVSVRTVLETVGSRSRGVSLTLVGARALLGYQDAVVGEARAFVIDLQLTASNAEPASAPRLLSDPAWLASAPRLAGRGDTAYAVWSERDGVRDEASGRIMFVDAGHPRAPVTLTTVEHEAPAASLAVTDAQLALVYRDARDGREKAGLQVASVADDGRVLGAALRVARADGSGRPVLRACGAHLVAATPRTFAGDAFVGAVAVDLERSAVSGEQQFYEDSREFSQVAAACTGADALLLVAERATRGRGTAGLHVVPLRCQ